MADETYVLTVRGLLGNDAYERLRNHLLLLDRQSGLNGIVLDERGSLEWVQLVKSPEGAEHA